MTRCFNSTTITCLLWLRTYKTNWDTNRNLLLRLSYLNRSLSSVCCTCCFDSNSLNEKQANATVLWHFAFPKPECGDFLTETTPTCIQHSFEIECNEALFQSNVDFFFTTIYLTYKISKQRPNEPSVFFNSSHENVLKFKLRNV